MPTHRQLEGRGTRRKRTRGKWRGGRVRNMLVNPIYKGEIRFGQRTKKERVTISAKAPVLIPEAVWQAAQDTLARHRVCARNTTRIHLLKGVISCGHCGLNYIGSYSDGKTWYRCNGRHKHRGPTEGRCHGRNIQGGFLEPRIWQDIELFLKRPGDLLTELDGHVEREAEATRIAAEAADVRRRLDDLADERREMPRQRSRGRMTDEELDDELTRIRTDRQSLESRMAALEPPPTTATPAAGDRTSVDSNRPRQPPARLLIEPVAG